jgi:hypothetical protein
MRRKIVRRLGFVVAYLVSTTLMLVVIGGGLVVFLLWLLGLVSHNSQ